MAGAAVICCSVALFAGCDTAAVPVKLSANREQLGGERLRAALKIPRHPQHALWWRCAPPSTAERPRRSGSSTMVEPGASPAATPAASSTAASNWRAREGGRLASAIARCRRWSAVSASRAQHRDAEDGDPSTEASMITATLQGNSASSTTATSGFAISLSARQPDEYRVPVERASVYVCRLLAVRLRLPLPHLPIAHPARSAAKRYIRRSRWRRGPFQCVREEA